MADPTIVLASLSDDKLKESINSLVKHVNDKMKEMVESTNSTVDAMEKKLKSLGNLKIDSGGSADGGASKRAKAQNAETAAIEKSNQAAKEKIMTLDQQASAINTVVQSEKKYTDEIIRQAKAVRENKAFKEEGFVRIGNDVFYNNAFKQWKNVASVEEQILQVNREREIAQQRIVLQEQREKQEKIEAAQAALQQLGIERQITQEQEKRRRYKAPETYTGFDVSRDKLSGLIARRNGILPSQVVNWDEQTSSIKTLSAALKQYQEAYTRMSATERNSPFGKQMISDMHVLERELQKLRGDMSRMSKEQVFNLPTKTLDDIAYKMRQLSSYRSGLDVSRSSKEISQVNDEYNRLKKRMDEVMQKNQQMIASNTALGRSWNYMKNRLAFYFTVGASTSFIKNLIEVRSQYEMNERALGILINSAERGTQIFNELSQMALVSPYTLIELSSAAKQLTAYDVAAKDVVDTTRRLADMAAAVGVPIERLTYALGQIKAYGYLNSRDNRMFANAGIPLVKQLSDYYTELEGRLVSTADVYDRIKKKQVGYEEVMNVITKMTDEGGKFYDFQAKMAETLKVQLANLTLAWNNMLNAMGEESQGVLVGGISALKQMFLHWKDIEHVLTEVVVAFGAYKAYQIVTTKLMGTTSTALKAQVLAEKQNTAAMLRKQALVRKLTTEELRLIATQNQLSAADYMNALSSKALTRQKAMLLIAFNRNNDSLKAAIVNMGLLTTQEVANMTVGKALAMVFKSIGVSIKNAALAMKTFMMSNWWVFLVGGIYEAWHVWDSYHEHIREINQSAAEHAKETWKNVKDYLESDVISDLEKRINTDPSSVSNTEAQKAWDEMREKIELSSLASNKFIASLLDINDINQRLNAGFEYLRDIEHVAGIMKTMSDNAVDVTSSIWGGFLREGLKDELKNYVEAFEKYNALSENLRASARGESYFVKLKEELGEFQGELEETTTSIYNFAAGNSLNTNEQREFFERMISEIAQKEDMSVKETRIFRMQAEEQYYAYAKAQLQQQLQYQQGAQREATRKRIEELDNEFGARKSMQESFFMWVNEKYAHEVRNRFSNMTKEEISHIDWSQGEWKKWSEKLAKGFSQEYGVAFDDLRKLVLNANTWSINIPVFFQTIGQPLSDVQRDYEARTGKKFSSNPLIKDAKTQVEILDILKKKQKEVANEMATAEKAGGKYWEDNKQRYKEENDALVADIHAYKALTDAEEKANKKSGKGGSKKDVLGDALTKEVQLIGEIQKRFKEYQQIGVNAQDAIRLATEEYDNTLKRTNATLAKYGISTKTSEELAGMNIRDVRDYYKSLLEMAKSTGNAKGIEAIEKALANINVEITKLDYKKITDGLNNELGKLKDEYELAVELDANPELGGMFADMMGIDTSSLPHTFGEAFEKANEIAKEKLKELKVDTSNFNLMSSIITADKDGMWMGQKLDSEPVQKLIAKQKEWRDMFKKNLLDTEKMLDDFVKKYGDYSDKVAEIESNRINQIKRLNDAYYTEEMRRLPEYYAKLNAINQGAKREESNAAFEEFKNSRYYTMMFENLDYISTKTIRDMRDHVRKLMDTMNGLTPEQLKTLISQYEKLEQKLSKRSPFRTLTKDLREYFSTIDERKEANKDFRAAQKEYDIQTKVVAELKKKYENAIAYKDENYDNLDELLDELDIQQEILDKLKEKLKLAEKTADKYNLIKKLALEEASGVAKVISANLQSLGELRDNLQESFGIEFSEDINNVIDGLSKVGDGINKITSSAMSGDVVGALSGVASVVKGFGDAIFGGKKDYFTPMKEAIEGLIAVMEKVADYQLEALGKMTGSRAVAEYRKLLQNNNKVIESYRNLAHAAGESGSSAGSHSYAARTNKSLANDWKEISRLVGQTVNSVQDLYNLSSEQLKDIMTNMPTTWLRIDEDIRIALEGIIEYGDKAKEYADALGVALTNISLDDLTNDFENMLQDMNVSSKDFADNFEDYMRNAIIRSMMAGTYTKELENWYKNFQEKISDNTLSQSDIEQLRAEYMSIVERALDERDKYLEVIGSSGSKDLSALQQGIQSISESTAESLAAYMNGVSQQVYYQSDVLTQIRNTIQSFDIDVQTGTLSEMLLQLQQSYQVQMSIQNILQGVLTPSGQGFRVELLS